MKLISCSTELKILTAHKSLNAKNVFILLMNVKMPTIVGILTFISKINFVLR